MFWDPIVTEQVVRSEHLVTLSLSFLTGKVFIDAQQFVQCQVDQGGSPFAASARAAGKTWSGGKMDDITSIVAQVQEAVVG